MKFLCALILIIAISNVQSGPLHASCQLTWNWPKTACKSVQDRLVAQIKTWNTDDNCKNGGEKCLYKLVSQSDSKLQATHETPVKHYVDDLTFAFTSASSPLCSVAGNSKSETWYAVLDYGTNYCNMRNLLEGAGLDKEPGFTEVTNDNICTQYSTANCTVY